MTHPTSNAEQPISRMGLSLTVILFGSFLAPLLMHSSTLAIPAIASELSLTANTISWFTFVTVLANICLVLPAGKLADKFGRKKIFSVGLLIGGVACIIGGAAQADASLLFARTLQGISMAFVFGSAVALVMSIPPEEDKVRVMGLYISVAYMGIVVGPIFGGYVINNFDWRLVFYIPGGILIVLSAIGLFALPWERYGDRDTRLRALDVSLYVVSLTMIAFGMVNAASFEGQLMLLGGVLMFAAFFVFQSMRRDPLLQVKLFLENKTFLIISCAHMLVYCGIFALPFTLTLYLQYIQALDAQTTGLILLSQALCTAVIAPFAGWLSDRVSARTLILSGTSMFLTAMIMLSGLSNSTSQLTVIIALSLIGLAVGVMDAPKLHTSMKSVNEKLLGSASATMNGMRTMGGFIGVGVASLLIELHIGGQEIIPSIYPQLMSALNQFFLSTLAIAILGMSLLVYGLFWVIDLSKAAD